MSGTNKLELFVLHELSDEFLKIIKLNFVFGQETSEVIFVSKDDQCYGLGENHWGLLGLGHNNHVKEPTIIKELCFKNIINFASGLNFVIALTIQGSLFSWGKNDYGQLGNGTENNRYNKPALIEVLSSEFVSAISCGSHHSLALTEKGEVYAWGKNGLGQIGNGSDSKKELKPVRIIMVDKQRIIAISCGELHSIALTENGIVYSWGNNKLGQLGVKKISILRNLPEKIDIFEENEKVIFEKVCCGPYYTLILSIDGIIYAFGSNKYGQLGNKRLINQFSPRKIVSEKKFIDIAAHRIYNISVALSNEGVYYVWGLCKGKKITCPKATHYHSINAVFLSYKNITYKVIDNDFKTESETLYEFKQEEFQRNYHEFNIISSGSSGIVTKAKSKFGDEIYAIKMIATNEKFSDYILRELRIMSQLKSDYVVKIKHAWVEPNYLIRNGYERYQNFNITEKHPLFKSKNEKILHIKMELCEKTLKEIIEWMTKKLDIDHPKIISPLCYFIASEFLVEILECLDYLHNHNPPIIHRDLKPTNILITNGENGRFVKLADFGLATTHESKMKTHTKSLGTRGYIAPEVYNTPHYDTKADMYSLGVVTQKLFVIDLNRDSELTTQAIFHERYKYLSKIIEEMMSVKSGSRPTCKKLLEERKEWALRTDDKEILSFVQKFIDDSENLKENFFYFIIREKLKYIHLNSVI